MANSIKNSLILLKLEATHGTDAVPTPNADAVAMQVADFSLQIEERSATNETVGTGFGAVDEIPYARRAKVTFQVPLSAPSAVVAPAWAGMLRACAVTETVAASEVVYTPASAGIKSASIYGYVNGKVQKLVYGQGNPTFNFKTGEVPTLAVDYTALVASVTAGAVPAATLTSWRRPLAFGPATCSGVKLGGALFALRELELDGGCEVQDVEMAGPESIGIYDWAPKITATVDVSGTALATLHSDMNAGTTRALELRHGGSAGVVITLTAPACQIVDIDSVREGKLWLSRVTLACLPTAAGNDAWRVAISQLGAQPQDPQPYDMAWLDQYRVEGTPGQLTSSAFLVPYPVEGGAPVSWSEPALGGAASTRMMIRTGATLAPVGQRKAMLGCHPTTNGGFEDWADSSRPVYALISGWLGDGHIWCNVDSRHPQVSLPYLPGGTPAPAWDTAYATQMLRALHVALGLDLPEVYAIGRSRGSQVMLQALSADRANPTATTYEGRMSTKLKAVAVMQGQVFWSAADNPNGEPGFARKAIVAGDYNAAVAANPVDDARIFAVPSPFTAAKTTAVDTLFLYEADPTWVGYQLTLAQYNNSAIVPDKIHYPDAGLWLLESMTQAGRADQLAINCSVGAGDSSTYVKYLAWFRAIINKPTAITRTVTAVEHAAMVEAAATGCNLYYVPPDATGCAVNADGTGTVAPGTTIAGIVDWSLGLANAVNVPLGSQVLPAAMTASQYQPSVVAVSGGQMALQCVTGKYLQVGRANTSADIKGATPGGWVSVLRTRAPGNYKFCPDGTTAGVVVAAINGAVPATAERAAKQLGRQIMGVTYPLT